MGFVLGSLGGGGGILTVPILVGFFAMTATEATGGSLLVVGLTSLIGAIEGFAKRSIEVSSAFLIAIPATIGAFTSRKFIVPFIPDTVLGVPRDDLLLGLFAVVMVYVGAKMLKPTVPRVGKEPHRLATIAVGFGIGVVSGTLGAGGGFLILPALTLLLDVELKRAIPTSLLVISIQSLGGFTGEIGKPIQYGLLASVAAVALVGLGVGLLVRQRVPKRGLQIGFSVLVFAVAAWMILKITLNHF